MHQSKIKLDAFADAFKEDFGIDVASHTVLILMLLIAGFAGQIDCCLGCFDSTAQLRKPRLHSSKSGLWRAAPSPPAEAIA